MLDNLYTGLRAVFTRAGKLLLSPTEQTPKGESVKNVLRILADQLLFRDLNPSVESLRTKRAQAADEFITIAREAGVEVGEKERHWVGQWLAQERAGPIQRILEAALRKI